MHPASADTAKAPLYGLVLAGGKSRRMQRDKAALELDGNPALHRAYRLLQAHCDACFVSIRADQADDPVRRDLPHVVDDGITQGPLAGIVSALNSHPECAWLVVACDLPLLDNATLSRLIAHRADGAIVTAFASAHDGLPEPLCAIYEPASLPVLLDYAGQDVRCPRKILLREDSRVTLLPDAGHALDNVNTPEDLAQVSARLHNGGAH
ncbi:MAG: NTP transferase domain-containing protein [Pseudomonadota bacterium]